MLDPNALVFTFGAISTGAIALVFAFKWWIGDRQPYDRDWALAHFLFAGAVGAAAVQYAYPEDWPGMVGVALYWAFTGLMVTANLDFTGHAAWRRPIFCLCAALAILSLSFGLYRINDGFTLFAVVLTAIYFWTAWILRNLPRIGVLIAIIFAIRGGLVLFRPFVADSPHLFAFSILSFTSNFLAGAALMAGSLLRSGDLLLASRQRVSTTNAELQRSNRLLEEQALRLEHLGADYVAALQRAEKANRAKDSFISNMNHEFRTPLNAVLGFSELIRTMAERKGETEIKEYADFAFEGGQAMLRNVNRILDFVALDAGDRAPRHAPFDPRAAVEEEIHALAEMAQAKRLRIAPVLDESPAAWPGDEHAFRAIIDELLRNALTAAPEASTVTVSIACDADTLVLQIADTGNGLSDAFRATVGESFNISESVLHRGGDVQGVGLGLCIAARYAKLMGGALNLERNSPKGTIARVLLSGAPDAAA